MKPIILLTVPHTGTHTMMYLLNVLGNAKTYHSHITKADKAKLTYLFNLDLSDAVIIYTHRNRDDHQESWDERYSTTRIDKALDEHYSVQDWALKKFDQSDWRIFHLNINQPRHHRHAVIGMACLEAEVPYTPEMQAFVELWPKMNARGGEEVVLTEEEADALSRAKRSRVENYMLEHHNFSYKEKRYVT